MSLLSCHGRLQNLPLDVIKMIVSFVPSLEEPIPSVVRTRVYLHRHDLFPPIVSAGVVINFSDNSSKSFVRRYSEAVNVLYTLSRDSVSGHFRNAFHQIRHETRLLFELANLLPPDKMKTIPDCPEKFLKVEFLSPVLHQSPSMEPIIEFGVICVPFEIGGKLYHNGDTLLLSTNDSE